MRHPHVSSDSDKHTKNVADLRKQVSNRIRTGHEQQQSDFVIRPLCVGGVAIILRWAKSDILKNGCVGSQG